MANVILEISSKLGPGGFTELKSAIDLVSGLGRAVADTMSDLDQFAAVMRRADRDIVTYADSAAKGLIDTTEIAKQFNALMVSGMEPTKEQFAALSKAAVDLAQRTGQDATQAFRTLNDALIRGSDKTLRKYGIEVGKTNSLLEKQTAIFEQVENKFGDVEVEMLNNTERLYALSNSWGTLIGTVWGKVTGGKGIVGTILEKITASLDEATMGIVSMTNETLTLDNAMKVAEITAIGWNQTLLEIGNTLGIVSDEVVEYYRKLGSKKAADLAIGISQTKRKPETETGLRQTPAPESKKKKAGGDMFGFMGHDDTGFEVSRGYGSIIEAMVAGVEDARSEINDILGAPGDMSLAGIGLEGGLDMLGEDPLIAMAEKMAKGTASAYDMKVEMLELALAMQEVSNSSIEMSSEMAAADVQSMALKGTQDALRGSLNMAFDAMISGAGSGKKAFMAMISGVLKGIAVESTIKALFEAAEAIAAFASYRYDQGAQHAIAAGLYTGVAAAAAAGAVASGRAANKERSRGDVRSGIAQGKATSTGSFVSPTASSQPQTQTVKIVMDDSAAGFDAIVEQNNAATAAGRRSFQAA